MASRAFPHEVRRTQAAAGRGEHLMSPPWSRIGARRVHLRPRFLPLRSVSKVVASSARFTSFGELHSAGHGRAVVLDPVSVAATVPLPQIKSGLSKSNPTAAEGRYPFGCGSC